VVGSRSLCGTRIGRVTDLEIEVEDLFPTHGAIDEEHQIGRTATIVGLAERVREHSDALLLHPRKIGKTSVARAALERVRSEDGCIVAEVDCTAAGVRDGNSLAQAILSALQDQGGKVSRKVAARATVARQQGRLGRLRKGADSAQELGLDDATVLAGVLDLLGTDGPSLDDVLEELARLGKQRTVGLFLDEVQEIAQWDDRDDVQEALARFMRRDGRRVAVIAAGSDQATTEALFAHGKPLHWDFEPFDVPEIDRVDWHQGIAKRFNSAGYQIDAARIDQILATTGGHPLRTMSVAKQTLREVRQAGEQDVSWAAVDAAIAQAKRHPSWKT
jgi:hypothetical protein